MVWTQLCHCVPSKSMRRIVLGCQHTSNSSLFVVERPFPLEINSFSRSLEIKLTASASAAVWSITRITFRYRYGPETSNVIGYRSLTIWIYTCFMHCVRPNLYMFHQWLSDTDGTSSTIRTALFDFRRAFDLVDHHILVTKLLSLRVKPSAVNWIIDFLRGRQQRVKVNGVFSDWLDVPGRVPH